MSGKKRVEDSPLPPQRPPTLRPDATAGPYVTLPIESVNGAPAIVLGRSELPLVSYRWPIITLVWLDPHSQHVALALGGEKVAKGIIATVIDDEYRWMPIDTVVDREARQADVLTSLGDTATP